MKTIPFLLLSTAIFTMSCTSNSQRNRSEAQVNPTETIAEDTIKSYQFYGTYEGTLPAADCEGIKTKITLNEDTTYDLLTEYLGKETRPMETCGVYNVLANNVVELIEPSSDNRTYYKVVEDAIILSDSIGTVNQGELADFYVLQRK